MWGRPSGGPPMVPQDPSDAPTARSGRRSRPSGLLGGPPGGLGLPLGLVRIAPGCLRVLGGVVRDPAEPFGTAYEALGRACPIGMFGTPLPLGLGAGLRLGAAPFPPLLAVLRRTVL